MHRHIKSILACYMCVTSFMNNHSSFDIKLLASPQQTESHRHVEEHDGHMEKEDLLRSLVDDQIGMFLEDSI